MPASVSFRMPSWTLATPIIRKPAAELKSLQSVTGIRGMLCGEILLAKPGTTLGGPSSTVESLEARSNPGAVLAWMTVRVDSLETAAPPPTLQADARNLAPLSLNPGV